MDFLTVFDKVFHCLLVLKSLDFLLNPSRKEGKSEVPTKETTKGLSVRGGLISKALPIGFKLNIWKQI